MSHSGYVGWSPDQAAALPPLNPKGLQRVHFTEQVLAGLWGFLLSRHDWQALLVVDSARPKLAGRGGAGDAANGRAPRPESTCGPRGARARRADRYLSIRYPGTATLQVARKPFLVKC